jgi:eukaryotic-like serine/threonine-protein kinase
VNSVVPSPYPGPGEIVDAWIIDKIMGEGGMGAVARAYHGQLQTPVAIKFMNPQFLTFPGARERFLNEGRASGRIKSDHVVPVSHAGETDKGVPYLVMECLNGLDLADLLARDGTPGLPIQRAVHFLLQVLRALQAAHAVGIVHRDMKPSNCFVVNNDGEEDFVKILDFGISKVQQPGGGSLTQTNSALGTPLYMSPEQAKSPRDVDGRSDIYSVGVILYELLTGHTPFFSESGEFTEILFKLFTADPPPVQSTRPDLPDELAAVVHKALAREPADRYSTPLEFAEALAVFGNESAKHITSKMKAFKPPKEGSIAPPEHLAPSMAAFSQLRRPAGQGTDVMAERPRIEAPKLPHFTEALQNAPGRVVAAPPTSTTRATQDEAAARTQYGSHPDGQSDAPVGAVTAGPGVNRTRLMAPGERAVSTDLGASRDTTQSTPAPESKKNMGMLVALAAGATVVGIIAVVAFKGTSAKATNGGAPSASTAAISATPTEAPTNITVPPSPLPSATVSATASASASASATNPIANTKPPVTPSKQPSSKPPTTHIPGVSATTQE